LRFILTLPDLSSPMPEVEVVDFSRSIGLTQPLSFVDTSTFYITDFNPNKKHYYGRSW
jgi:hypothetical protein